MIEISVPKELIAQTPIEPRDSSRLLIIDRKTGTLKEDIFRNIVNYLTPNDVLVLNNTKVIPARIRAVKPTGGKLEILLLRKVGDASWECLIKPRKRLKGNFIYIGDTKVEVSQHDNAIVINFPSVEVMNEIIRNCGEIPLPPYIKTKLQDPERYQTVFAEVEGSVAGHTAALHFTKELLERIKNKGVEIVYITLHMGYDSFRILDQLKEYRLSGEEYNITPEAAETLSRAKREGRRIVACGTSTVRTLESSYDGEFKPGKNITTLFIKPGYKFKVVDSLITNFHLPRTTNLLLTCAFMGEELTLKVYKYAIENKFRFYTFGDSSFII